MGLDVQAVSEVDHGGLGLNWVEPRPVWAEQGYRSRGGRLVLSCPGRSSVRQEVPEGSQRLASWWL